MPRSLIFQSLVSFKFIELQDSNASSSSGTSTPAPEHQSNNDQDILRGIHNSHPLQYFYFVHVYKTTKFNTYHSYRISEDRKFSRGYW